MQSKKVITASMDSKEIISLLKEDAAFAWHKIDETSRKYLKLAKNYSYRKERVFFKPVSFKSAKGFNYVYRYYKRAADEKSKSIIGCQDYIWFVKERGIYAIRTIHVNTLMGSSTVYHIYTPHFFDRYRERFLKDLSIDKLKVIETFMFANDHGMALGFSSEKYPDSVWSRCVDGLCLCNQINDSIYEFKTFVTFAMSQGGQRQKFIDFTNVEGQKNGFEFSLPDEDFEEFSEK